MIFPGLEVFISNFRTFPRFQDTYKPPILYSNQSKASSVQHSPVCISHTHMQKQSPTSHSTPPHSPNTRVHNVNTPAHNYRALEVEGPATFSWLFALPGGALFLISGREILNFLMISWKRQGKKKSHVVDHMPFHCHACCALTRKTTNKSAKSETIQAFLPPFCMSM